MTTAIITREQCRSRDACYTDTEVEAFIPQEGISPSDLVSLIGETRAWRTLTAADCHWALCNGVPEPERFAKQYRLHAVWCALRELARVKSPDPRSVAAVDVAERFANGLATKAALAAAMEAASAAACEAGWGVARNAAWSAARAAASAAARYAAWSAAWAAASDAASSAERLEQCKDLAARLETP